MYNISSDSVKSRVTYDPDKVSVVLLNGLSGADTFEVDPCNKRPVEFLKAHNGEVSKEAHEHHSYWSYSVITLNKEMLSQIIEGLNVLPVPDQKPSHRNMARC